MTEDFDINNKEAQELMTQCLTAYHTHNSGFERIMDEAVIKLSEEQWEELQEKLKPFTVFESLEILANGHTIMTVLSAMKVCEAVEVEFDTKLAMVWRNREHALKTYGFFAMDNKPGKGVDGLDLSYYVAEKLGLGRPGQQFSGKGFQAQANSRAIAQHLSKTGKV